MKNFRKIAMRCTQEQFDAIKPRLKALGLIVKNITSFDTHPYLNNDYNGEDNIISNCHLESKYSHERALFEEWNEEIFLSACGRDKQEIIFDTHNGHSAHIIERLNKAIEGRSNAEILEAIRLDYDDKQLSELAESMEKFNEAQSYKVLASDFLKWHTKDEESLQILGERTADRMKKTGYGDISVEELWKETSEIPTTMIKNWDRPSILEIDRQIYNITFVNDIKE